MARRGRPASGTAPHSAGGGCDPARIGSGRHGLRHRLHRSLLRPSAGSVCHHALVRLWSSGCCWPWCWACGWRTSVIASRARPAHPPGSRAWLAPPCSAPGWPLLITTLPQRRSWRCRESAGPCLSCRSCGTGRPRRSGSPLSSPSPPKHSPCWEPSWRSATAPVGSSAPRPPRWFSGSPSTSSPPPGSTYANWSPGTATTGSPAVRWPSLPSPPATSPKPQPRLGN